MNFEYNSPDLAFSNTLNMNLFRFHVAKTKEDAILVNKMFRESKSFSKFKTMLYQHLQVIDIDTLNKEYDCLLNSKRLPTVNRTKQVIPFLENQFHKRS